MLTAVLAVTACAVLAAVLVLAWGAAVLVAALGLPGWLAVAWLAVEFAVVTGAVLGLAALRSRGGGTGDG